jgi:polyhydroxyalkanoate synthesis regulator phasin
MEDLLKKFIYTGVGLVALTAEKVQEIVDDLVNDGKLTKDEGKKILGDILETTETKKDEYEDKLKTFMESIVERFNLPTRSELESLQKRIKSLEKQLDEEKKKTAVAKTPAKRGTTPKPPEKK